MRKFLVFIAVLLFSSVSPALTLDQISGTESAGGLKEALTQGAGKAVELLGAKDGFLGNPKVKIGLPGNLDKAAKMMRKLGMGGTIDELETAMNRAAEAAVPEAKKLLVDSIKSMSVDDAKGILTGGDNAATEYFKRSTSEPLKEKFKPIVQQAMAKVKVATRWPSSTAARSRTTSNSRLVIMPAHTCRLARAVSTASYSGSCVSCRSLL